MNPSKARELSLVFTPVEWVYVLLYGWFSLHNIIYSISLNFLSVVPTDHSINYMNRKIEPNLFFFFEMFRETTLSCCKKKKASASHIALRSINAF